VGIAAIIASSQSPGPVCPSSRTAHRPQRQPGHQALTDI